MFKWIISLSCLGLFCTMLVLAGDSHRQVQSARDRIESLQTAKGELLRLDEKHQEKQKRAEQWNIFWEQAVEAGLHPDKWQAYPVNIEDTLTLNEAENILTILSSKMNESDSFWFSPGSVRVIPEIDSGENREDMEVLVEMHIQGKIMTMIPESARE
ncbi:hypothetical protein Dthio_PD2662 [Desulfonatronospira thiodismutans ASO3-1]|uniref:Fimbrial assembly family protein n=1 Tax=Desulfonatronospira thiodismutans ASO3-1 TaxID=555779 RepID=D6SKP0_9BACT|nr:hypothetical protein [Desulfonatronospira thiodismutans]EFI35251.1 hypothetical protein Dthio_PD2662 [Desulfonatronospira thiodismutans ASO3-1]